MPATRLRLLELWRVPPRSRRVCCMSCPSSRSWTAQARREIWGVKAGQSSLPSSTFLQLAVCAALQCTHVRVCARAVCMTGSPPCSHGLVPADTATNGVCEASNCTKMVSIAGHKLVEANNEQALMAALVQQPVAVAIEADKVRAPPRVLCVCVCVCVVGTAVTRNSVRLCSRDSSSTALACSLAHVARPLTTVCW